VTLVEGRAHDRIATGAHPTLARIGLRAGVAVDAPRPVGLGGVRADAGQRVARPRDVTLVLGGAYDRVGAGADPVLARVGLRAGATVRAGRAVGHGLGDALVLGLVANAGVALIAGADARRAGARAAAAGVVHRAEEAVVTGGGVVRMGTGTGAVADV